MELINCVNVQNGKRIKVLTSDRTDKPEYCLIEISDYFNMHMIGIPCKDLKSAQLAFQALANAVI